MDAAQNNKIYEATHFIETHPLAGRVFRIVSNQVGVTGWQIVRETQSSPQAVEQTLLNLLNLDVVRADGQGLEGYYLPSGAAYAFGLRRRFGG